jgi:microcystin-dependent protein
LDLRKRLQSILLRSQAKMPAHSQHLSTADGTAIAIAAAGGAMAVVTAAASAIVADIQSDRSLGKAVAAIGSVRTPALAVPCSASDK